MGFSKIMSDILLGKTGNEFEKDVSDILEKHFASKGQRFYNPSDFGGDDGNDGWCPEEGNFFQVFSKAKKITSKESLEKETKTKFKKDFFKLFQKIEEGNWNIIPNVSMKIKKFIFIVCNKTNPVKNQILFFEEVKNNLIEKKYLNNEDKKSYISVINMEIWGTENILDILLNLEYSHDDLFEKLLMKLNLYDDFLKIKKETINYTNYMKVCRQIKNLNTLKNFNNEEFNNENFKILNINAKIQKNNLNEKWKKTIQERIHIMPIIKKAEDNLNLENPEIFDFVKKEIINLYCTIVEKDFEKNSNVNYNDVLKLMFDKTINLVSENSLVSYSDPIELETNTLIIQNLIIYIFENCDIFLK